MHPPPQFDPTDRLLSLQETAAFLSVSRRTLYRMIEDGTLPRPMQLGSEKTLRYRASTLERWLAGKEASAERDREKRSRPERRVRVRLSKDSKRRLNRRRS